MRVLSILYMGEDPIEVSSISFIFFLSNLVAQNFYFYIVNPKLQQQWENERPEKKKKNWIVLYFTIFLQNIDVVNFLLVFI